MRLLPDSEALAIGLSAFMQKGGWLIAPLGGMALLYLLQNKLVFNPVNTPISLYRASAQPGVDPHRVGLIGRSLGSGVAAYVASERPAAAVVLITPYDSIVEIARRRFPYCAARILLKHRFDALGFARRARAPALMLLAE